MSNRKYHIIGMICVILVSIFIILGIRYNYNNSKKKIEVEPDTQLLNNKEDETSQNNSTEVDLSGSKNEYFPGLTEITMDQYVNAYKNGEKLILFTGRHTCGACSTFGPILENVLKDYPDLVIYYIDSSKVDKSGAAYTEFKTLDDSFKEGYTYVPWFILANTSKVISEEIGVMEYEEVVELLKEKGFIN